MYEFTTCWTCRHKLRHFSIDAFKATAIIRKESSDLHTGMKLAYAFILHIETGNTKEDNSYPSNLKNTKT